MKKQDKNNKNNKQDNKGNKQNLNNKENKENKENYEKKEKKEKKENVNELKNENNENKTNKEKIPIPTKTEQKHIQTEKIQYKNQRNSIHSICHTDTNLKSKRVSDSILPFTD